MRVEKIDASDERSIVIGVITSTNFCKRVFPLTPEKYLRVSYARTIVEWVRDYFMSFGTAPQKDIVNIYLRERGKIHDDDTREIIETFLESVSADYASIASYNEAYALSRAYAYVKKIAYENLTDQINALNATGDVDKIDALIAGYKIPAPDEADAVDTHLLASADAIREAFDHESEFLFSFSGALGAVCGKFNREDFIAFAAGMKRGKSFALIHTAVVAAQKGYNVAFFSLEMSKNAIITRMWSALTGIPATESAVEIPFFRDGEVVKKSENRIGVDTQSIEARQKTLRRISNGGNIKIIPVPAYSADVNDIDAMLDGFFCDGFTPDVIIIDYADILKAIGGGREYRNQLDDTWKRLRGLAQRRKALVATATQSTRGALSHDLREEDIAEDIRKLAHVTAMIAINATREDRELGVSRLQQLAIREGASEHRQAVVTQCFSIAQFAMDSKFSDEVNLSGAREVKAVCRKKTSKGAWDD